MIYEYVYLGDRSTAVPYKGQQCVVVQARLLRKIKRPT